MGECRGGDGLIKLFGKTFPVAPDVAKDLQQQSGSSSSSTESDIQETAAVIVGDPSPQSEVDDGDDPATAKSPPPTTGGEAAKEKEKLKKPDKILPCPRCSSMDTKFCYFNNYNVNQPRHFCKHCQRYWTAGGAMRNVPVGAGRRKNKHAVSAASHHFLHRAAIRAIAATGVDSLLNSNNGTVLSFGTHDVAPPQPQPLTVDLAGQMTRLNKERVIVDGEVSSNRDDQNYQSSSSTVAKPAIGLQQQQHPATMNGWPYGCAPSPTYYTSGIAIPIYPASAVPPAYWGCMIPPPPGAWTSLPWPPAVQSQVISSSSPTSAPSVSSSLPTLGKKHPREGGDEGRDDDHGYNGKLWAPKTIRIDNADEVARSSIRSLFGFRGGDKEDDDTTGTHKLATTVFEAKRDGKMAKKPVIASLPLLHSNPVALTRSATFQEGS